MYRKDGEEYFIVDAHIALWDARPENQRNIHGKQFIDCFYDYHRNLSPESELWSYEDYLYQGGERLMRDIFDLAACVRLLRRIESGEIKITTVESTRPSPFAAALLFSYVANYIYEGDAPLAERRAQALALDQSQLQELLGETDLRELLDAAVIDEVEARLQALDPEYQAKHADAIHDLLVKLGDLTHEEIQKRSAIEVAESVRALEHARRIVHVQLAGERRYVAVEDAAKYRDAFGVPLPPGLPAEH